MTIRRMLKVRDELKAQLATLRRDIGDDGSHYPGM